jgi:hypothetical protein
MRDTHRFFAPPERAAYPGHRPILTEIAGSDSERCPTIHKGSFCALRGRGGMIACLSKKNQSALRFLEALAIKLQRPAILSDSTNNTLRSARRKLSFDFNCDLHLGVQQTCQVLNYRSGYHIRVP